MSGPDELYSGREQTLVKHRVLDRYLQRFAFIIGSWSESITYVDCYSGPWEQRSEDYTDTSFDIAIRQLQAAKRELGKPIRLRCFFIEKDRNAFAKLSAYAEKIDDVEIETRNASFEDSIDEIIKFVQADPKTFPFFLIDPKGWSIPLDVITPLLRQSPGEVLITFMLEFIRRFVDHPQKGVRDTFDGLYGEPGITSQFAGLKGDDRDDALLREYVSCVQKAGGFEYASSSLVLHPEKARRHFNLVYLTRHPKGIEAFKEAEKKAMSDMEKTRAEVAKRRRESGGQIDLFGAEELHKNEYFDGLRERSLRLNADIMQSLLAAERSVLFDDLWAAALKSPLIWPSDVKDQIAEWVKAERVVLAGLSDGQRVPKLNQGNRVVLRSD